MTLAARNAAAQYTTINNPSFSVLNNREITPNKFSPCAHGMTNCEDRPQIRSTDVVWQGKCGTKLLQLWPDTPTLLKAIYVQGTERRRQLF